MAAPAGGSIQEVIGSHLLHVRHAVCPASPAPARAALSRGHLHTLTPPPTPQALEAAEEKLDADIERLERLGEDDLERMRRERLDQLKRMHKQKQDWQAQVRGGKAGRRAGGLSE